MPSEIDGASLLGDQVDLIFSAGFEGSVPRPFHFRLISSHPSETVQPCPSLS